MNAPDAPSPSPVPRPEEKHGTAFDGKDVVKHLCPILTALAAAALCVGLVALDEARGNKFVPIIHLSYFGFALLGVAFHMAAKYREVRDEGVFDLKKYWVDYVFRLFQACLYVFIIDNLNGDESQLTINMYVVALFTGLYIRKVESAIENLGDRFGDMLSGILGSPADRKRGEKPDPWFTELKTEHDRLWKDMLATADKSPETAAEIKAQLQDILPQLKTRSLETAKKALMDVEFKLRGL